MKPVRRGLAALAACLVLAVAAAACSADDKDATSDDGGGGGGGATAPGVTADSIKVGGVGTNRSAGTGGAGEPDSGIGARARLERANEEGGIAGREIEFVGMKDDTGDAPHALQVTRELVQGDDVFAVLPVTSPVFQTSGEYLVENGIPFFGWAITPAFCNNDYGFGFNGCLVPTEPDNEVSTAAGGLVADLVAAKGLDPTNTTVALIAEETPAGTFGVTVIKAALMAAGLDVVYSEASIPANQAVSDWSPYVSAIMGADQGGAPDVMFHVTLPNNSVGLGTALDRAGFDGIQVDAVSYNPQRLRDAESRAALQGRYVFLSFAPFETDDEAVAQMIDDLAAVGVDEADLTAEMAIGYWSADLFVAALEKTGKDLTRETFLAAANDGFTHEVEGALGTISYPEGHRVAGPCGALVQVDGEDFVPTIPLTCYDTTPLSIVSGG